jgi:predicted HicB family RNase H-like nuclease
VSPISDSQKKAVRKYKEKAYDRLEISVPKGRKAELQDHAQQQGESLNGFVNRAIDETMERDGGQTGEDVGA